MLPGIWTSAFAFLTQSCPIGPEVCLIGRPAGFGRTGAGGQRVLGAQQDGQCCRQRVSGDGISNNCTHTIHLHLSNRIILHIRCTRLWTRIETWNLFDGQGGHGFSKRDRDPLDSVQRIAAPLGLFCWDPRAPNCVFPGQWSIVIIQ